MESRTRINCRTCTLEFSVHGRRRQTCTPQLAVHERRKECSVHQNSLCREDRDGSVHQHFVCALELTVGRVHQHFLYKRNERNAVCRGIHENRTCKKTGRKSALKIAVQRRRRQKCTQESAPQKSLRRKFALERTQLEKDDYIENLHVLSCSVLLKAFF